jgi:hypothetical protein
MVRRSAGDNSKRQYERGATQMLDASAVRAGLDQNAAPQDRRLAALLEYLRRDGTLCDGTVSHYVQCARVAITRILGPEQNGEIARAVVAARDILATRKGLPDPLRGASRKLKNPQLVELGDVFSRLRWKFINTGDRLDLLLALYIIVMPRIGLRPVEITWTAWDGGALYTRTAKRAGRPLRHIPSEHWPPVYRAALGLLVKLVPRGLDDAEFESWRNVLASRLARASRWTRTGRRLSLYFARDIAIANWKQAGITPQLIAKLAGHAGLRSQHFYSSGRSGYGSRFVFLNDKEGQALLEEPNAHGGQSANDAGAKVDLSSKNVQSSSAPELSNSKDRGGTALARTEVNDEWEAMPTPAKKQTKSRQEGEQLWGEYMKRSEAASAQLENELVRIRNERMGGPAQKDDGSAGPQDNDGHIDKTPRPVKRPP